MKKEKVVTNDLKKLKSQLSAAKTMNKTLRMQVKSLTAELNESRAAISQIHESIKNLIPKDECSKCLDREYNSRYEEDYDDYRGDVYCSNCNHSFVY